MEQGMRGWTSAPVAESDCITAADRNRIGRSALASSSARIGQALATRDLLTELRETGTIMGGPPPFQKRDRSRFLQSLDQIVQNIKRTP